MNRTKNYPIKCPEFGGDTLDEYPQANTECRFLLDYQPECKYADISASIRKLREIECYVDQQYVPSFREMDEYLKETLNGKNSTLVIKELLDDMNEFVVFKLTNLSRVFGDIDEFFDENIHEAFIGLCAVNYLREVIPNFVYTYGIFRNPCIFQKDSQCNYLMIELIPGQTWKKFIRTATVDQFLDTFLQICLSLKLAKEKYDFTHYDLHYENVIIKRLSDPIEIQYDLDNIISTSLVATIIDFGSSHIKIEGFDYGRILSEGNIHNFSFWEHDIFKFLGFTIEAIDIETIRSRGKKILKEARNAVETANQAFEAYELPHPRGGKTNKIKEEDKEIYQESVEELNEATKNLRKAKRKYRKKMAKLAEMKDNLNIIQIRVLALKYLSFFKSNITIDEVLDLKSSYYSPSWLGKSSDFSQFIDMVKNFIK